MIYRMNLEQAANKYKVSKRTIYNLISRGFLHSEGSGEDRKVIIDTDWKFVKGFGQGRVNEIYDKRTTNQTK